jgi:CRP-like cAMP-binding protein
MSRTRRDLRCRVQRLRQVPLFANCSHAELVRIDGLGTEILVRPGTTLIREGDAGRDCFVALDGVATVERAGVPIAAITAGSIAGELALLDHAPRNATVVATTTMRVLVLTPAELTELLNIAPSVNTTFNQIADTRRTTACYELTGAVRNTT